MSFLPSLKECRFSANGNSAWTFLLQAEQEALTKSTFKQSKYENSLIAVRVLGFLLHDLWDNARRWKLGDTPYSRLVNEINSIRNEEKKDQFDALVELGLVYRNGLFRVFHCNAGVGSTRSRPESLTTFYDMKDHIIRDMKNSAPTQHNVRRQALLRDGFKCVVSGIFDLETWRALSPDEKPPRERERLSYTQATHFCPEFVEDGHNKTSASVDALLSMFGLEGMTKSLCSGAVDSLHNVVTLEASLHTMFDTFELWLEPVEGQEHTYKVCCPIADERGLLVGPLPPCITLRIDPSAEVKAAEENVVLGLPDPLLIALRAICARVANMSGATKQMEQILADMEDSTVLSDNGSMAALLATRLTMISG